MAGDSLFFLPNISGIGIQMVILGQAVNNGTSIIVFDQALSIQAPSTPFNADLCVTVLDPNAAGLSIAGMPITVSYSDPDTSNNTTCSNITFVSDTSGTSIVDAGGVKELLMVYPNPATDKISFALTLQQATAAWISVSDMLGREVKTHDFGNLPAGKQETLSLDVSELPAGIYSIMLYAGERRYTGKLRIQR